MAVKPNLRIPKTVKTGEVFAVKSMLKHPMQNGRRKDPDTGELIPRFIINKLTCTYNDRMAFTANLHTSMSSNPYFIFYLKGTDSGVVKLTWTDDNGESISAEHNITVQ